MVLLCDRLLLLLVVDPVGLVLLRVVVILDLALVVGGVFVTSLILSMRFLRVVFMVLLEFGVFSASVSRREIRKSSLPPAILSGMAVYGGFLVGVASLCIPCPVGVGGFSSSMVDRGENLLWVCVCDVEVLGSVCVVLLFLVLLWCWAD